MIHSKRPLFLRGLWVSFFFFLVCQPLFSQDYSKRLYRPAYPNEIFPEDEKELIVLDQIITSGSATPEELTQVLRALKNSDSALVVCHALNALVKLANLPISIVTEVTRLADSNNDHIRLQLALFLGWFARPSFFPAIFHLLSDPDPGVAGNALFVLHRFGIESLAGLPYVLKSYQRIPGGIYYPQYRDLFLKVPLFSISLTFNGLGIIIPYSPPPLETNLHFGSSAVLPLFKKNLSVITCASDSSISPITPPPTSKKSIKNLRLPQDHNLRIGKIKFNKVSLKVVLSGLSAFSGLKILYVTSQEKTVDIEYQGKTVEIILNELLETYSLDYHWSGDTLIITPKKQ